MDKAKIEAKKESLVKELQDNRVREQRLIGAIFILEELLKENV